MTSQASRMLYARERHCMSKITRRKFLGLDRAGAARRRSGPMRTSSNRHRCASRNSTAGPGNHAASFISPTSITRAMRLRGGSGPHDQRACARTSFVSPATWSRRRASRRKRSSFIRQIGRRFTAPGKSRLSKRLPFAILRRAFAATGGAWLPDRAAVLPEHDLELVGYGPRGVHAFPSAGQPPILLMHYPEMANGLHERRFDLILAGHSHGGQVRLPFLGAIDLPRRELEPYEHGYYETPGGPLYVNAGIGTYRLPVALELPARAHAGHDLMGRSAGAAASDLPLCPRRLHT